MLVPTKFYIFFLENSTQIEISDILVEDLDTSSSQTAAAFSKSLFDTKGQKLYKYYLF